MHMGAVGNNIYFDGIQGPEKWSAVADLPIIIEKAQKNHYFSPFLHTYLQNVLFAIFWFDRAKFSQRHMMQFDSEGISWVYSTQISRVF